MQTFDDVSQYDSEDDERNEVCIRQLEESEDWNEDTLSHQINDAADTPEQQEVVVGFEPDIRISDL